MRILIVEDNAVDLKLLDAVLSTCGHATLLAHSAATGIAIALDGMPDLILLDLCLPDTDGLNFIRRIRSDRRTQRLPILALTAYPTHYASADLAAAGCYDLMIKPINTRTFPLALNEIVGKYGQAMKS